MDDSKDAPLDHKLTTAGVAKLPGDTPWAKAKPFVGVGSLSAAVIVISAVFKLNTLNPEFFGTASMLLFTVTFFSLSIAAVIFADAAQTEDEE